MRVSILTTIVSVILIVVIVTVVFQKEEFIHISFIIGIITIVNHNCDIPWLELLPRAYGVKPRLG